MKKLICLRFSIFMVTILLSGIHSEIAGQLHGYEVQSFQSNYFELEQYESVGILSKGDPLWEYDFDLEFEFPFFDSVYSSVIYDGHSWGSFTDELDVAILLMDNDISYVYDNILDTNNITSDVRFTHKTNDGLNAFVLQFTNVRFFADPFEDSLDTYMNFQIWLKENGVMEVHFGEMHMDDTPVYEPGVGFYCYTTSGGVDTTEVCGPHMGISHPLDPDIAIGLQGAYDDYEVTDDVYSILTVLPPEGWVIRFKPMSVSTYGPQREPYSMIISPNPALSAIHLPVSNGQVVIYDAVGRIVFSGQTEGENLDVSSLAPGIFYVQMRTPEGISTGKFVKR